MGGFVGMRLAARWPERVRSLVLMNTSAEIEPAKNAPKYRALAAIAELLGPTAVLGRVAPIMFGRTTMTDPSRAGLLTDYRERATRTRRTIARAVRGVTDREDVLHLLAAIVAPTTILAGEEDVATPPEKSHRIHAGIPGSRLVLVQRAGHSSAIEAPEAVCSALDAHLARVRSGAAG
jgi:pimeloyl-ACP methyl ester carboxylesterase